MTVTSLAERPADEARAGEAVAPRFVHRLGDADARTDRERDGARSRQQTKWRHIERKAVVRPRNTERLAQPSGPPAQQALLLQTTALLHARDAGGRFERADQHCVRDAPAFAYEIEAPVNAVGAVHIRVPWRPEHAGVARSASVKAVGRGIFV